MDYYISESKGSDNNPGTQTLPWRTPDKVNAMMFNMKPGDRFFFERGGTYRIKPTNNIGSGKKLGLVVGSSGTAAQPIQFSAYGSGAEPVIKGSTVLTGFTLDSGTIWKVPCPEEPRGIWQDGKMIHEARSAMFEVAPKTSTSGDTGTSTKIVSSTALPAGLVNADVFIRTSAWSWHKRKVRTQSGNTITFDSTGYNLESLSWGFFLTGRKSFLTGEGQYYWDPVAKMLYIRFHGSASPSSSMKVEITTGATNDVGFSIAPGHRNVHVRYLRLSQFAGVGYFSEGPTNIIEACEVDRCFEGIKTYGENSIIRDNHVHDVWSHGIFDVSNMAGASVLIESNSVEYVGTVLTMGISPATDGWSYMGIRTSGKATKVKKNFLNTIGYTGIACAGNDLVEGNHVIKACSHISDGAAIAFDNADGLQILGNYAEGSVGNLVGVAKGTDYYKPRAKGIYFGNTKLNNIVVRGNVVIENNGSGIWIDHVLTSSGNIVEYNICAFNSGAQIGASDWSNSAHGVPGPHAKAVYDDKVNFNILIVEAGGVSMQFLSHHFSEGGKGVDFGNYGSNWIYSADTNSVFEEIHPIGINRMISVAEYEKRFGDKNTVLTEKPVLMVNPTFDTTTHAALGAIKDLWTAEVFAQGALVPFSPLQGRVMVSTTAPGPVDPVPPTTTFYTELEALLYKWGYRKQ